MRVDTMRAIDRYAGVVLTFLLTRWLRLYHLLVPEKQQPPRRLLFIELSEMGSTILAHPAMVKARKQLGCEIFFVIFAGNRQSLDLLATVAPAHIFVLRENNLFSLLVDSVRFCCWVRKQRIDTVVDLELFSRFTALLTGLSGAANRVGFYRFCNEGLYRGELLTHRVAYNPHIHIAANFMALVNSLLAPEPEEPYSKTRVAPEELALPTVHCPEEELTLIRQRIRKRFAPYDAGRHRLVLINPNASELLPQRRWPLDRYRQLIGRVLERDERLLVLITGAAAEHAEAASLCRQAGSDRCINFAGALELRELPALYTLAAVMVTNDSGPGHFAAITPLPTFVLFGPETPALYGPLGRGQALYAGLACSPCVSAANHRKTVCRSPRCMEAITVAQVMAAIGPTLEQALRG